MNAETLFFRSWNAVNSYYNPSGAILNFDIEELKKNLVLAVSRSRQGIHLKTGLILYANHSIPLGLGRPSQEPMSMPGIESLEIQKILTRGVSKVHRRLGSEQL